MPNIDLSVIVVSFNTEKLLADCIYSIQKYTKSTSYEIIIIDNASTDGSRKVLGDIKKIVVIKNKRNLGFAKANNQGMKKANGRYILLLNSDTQLVENSLKEMAVWMDKHPEVGIASCKLVNADKSLQPTGGSLPTLGKVFLWASFLDDLPFVGNIFGSYHPHVAGGFFEDEHKQDWVTGAFMLIRRQVINKIGYLDEDFFMYGEDVEYCLRARKAGLQVWYTPVARIIHLGSKTSERTIVGEFTALPKIYQKHFSAWQYPLLLFFLKVGAFLRIIFFGIRAKREEVKAYVQALAVS